MKKILCSFLYCILFCALSVAQQFKIQITIPSFPCVDSSYYFNNKGEIRNRLNELNLDAFEDFSDNDLAVQEYKRLLFKSDELDLVQLSLLSIFPSALLERLRL
ncbi:MAG: hypothetical protein AAF573_22515, partial [Bacteroidota bacterium]